DLGTNSIGWALVETNHEGTPIKIAGMGSRIIPLNSDERDQFQKGQAITKNQDRTTARTQRKGYDRKQLKKKNLINVLKTLNILPSQELLNLPSLELWKLRSDASDANKKITAEQLGRVLYMLNQKRGYKSARSEANQNKKDTDYVADVKNRYTQLKEQKQSIGQYFYDSLFSANRKNEYFHVKKKVYPREAYIEEFDTIIKAQKKNHPFLTDDVVNLLRNEILYYQRRLKSQKGLVSVCELEGFEKTYLDKETEKEKTIFAGPKVAPKTSPLFQLCKIWETVNNISLKVKTIPGSKYKWEERIPTLTQKQMIAEYLSKNSSLSFPKLLEILALSKDQVYVNKQITKEIQGNITYTEIHNILGDSAHLKFNMDNLPSKYPAVLVDKSTGEILVERDGLQVNPVIEKEPLYQLWHTIYSIKDVDECKKALIKRFEIDELMADKLSRLDFNKQGFGNKSNKALRKILPYLVEGFDYSKSCRLAGYNHANNLTKNEQTNQITKEKLTLLSKNSLRQPVVEKIINQMINVVNAILEIYGKPDEIRVELARELKQSRDERNDSDIQNLTNKKLHDEISKRLTDLGLPATKRYIQKYKYIFPTKEKKIKEANVANQCIYCGESFNLTEALSGDSFDVDHIVPKALLFDDSQANKVLVHRNCNADKTNQTAYDYILKRNGEQGLNAYLSRVDDWFKRGILSYGKMQRLKISFDEYCERKKQKKETEADKKFWEHFIDRQLRETQYIARKSKDILKTICNNITTTEGNVTAKLRELWGWDNVLMNLQLPKYRESTQTTVKEWTSDHGKRIHQKEEIINWTKRDDHRHHAIDALVIACTKQGFIQRINTLNASDVRNEMNQKVEEAGIEYNEKLTLLEKYLLANKPPFATVDVENEAAKILISFKAGKKVATKGIRKVRINGKKKIVQKDLIIPRGALHEQFVYGRIKVKDPDKTIKYLFENPDKIFKDKIKILVLKRLSENDNDTKKALQTLKNEPIYLDDKKQVPLQKATCFKEEYVIKYNIKDLKSKDIPFIVDEKVKQIVKKRLEKYNGKEKEAFKEPLWFNEALQIPILTVKCFTGLSAVEAIKKNEQGEDIGFAKTGSNHHIAIYEDTNGKMIVFHVFTNDFNQRGELLAEIFPVMDGAAVNRL
ncbi:MAG TPA: type II CRISPR RNA-guided endonuclease Cas9, partial [Bacteroidia bacterium]|nr:type II CRISPR RNA-guided endonuclease Cas9 [Bacteroidia bacterium]